jgi:hypothetical protein
MIQEIIQYVRLPHSANTELKKEKKKNLFLF